MSKRDDSGPAFPMLGHVVNGEWEPHSQFTGMSLRDYFAAHCPSDIAVIQVKVDRGYLMGRPFPEEGALEDKLAWNFEFEARLRYIYADAMLKARTA
jgi:hypothetical protein